MDTQTVLALIAAGSVLLNALIAGVFSVWLARINRAQKDHAEVLFGNRQIMESTERKVTSLEENSNGIKCVLIEHYKKMGFKEARIVEALRQDVIERDAAAGGGI